jgi:hypothetical protein
VILAKHVLCVDAVMIVELEGERDDDASPPRLTRAIVRAFGQPPVDRTERALSDPALLRFYLRALFPGPSAVSRHRSEPGARKWAPSRKGAT